jgi:hypothetical protein
MGALPDNKADSDMLEFGRVYISGRDRKAARKALQSARR